MSWLLGQLRRCDDEWDRARLAGDPWRDLAAWDFSERDAGPQGTAPADPWLAHDGLPGTRLRFVRTGVLSRELRAEGRQVSASVRGRVPWSNWGEAKVVRVGEQAFTSQRVSRSPRPETTATFAAGFPAPGTRVLADSVGLPVLCTWGRNFDRWAGAHIGLSGGRRFQFPVRGRKRASAIMTALDQDGNKVAAYRMVAADGRFPAPPQVEIAVHPDQGITDELLLILAVSAPWLSTYFMQENGGG